MDSPMLPMQTMMIINQHQVMFSQQQGEQLPGNPRSKQLYSLHDAS